MARNGLSTFLCAGVLLLGLCAWPAAGGDDPTERQKHLLAVQVALEQGLACLQRGDPAAAVAVLEKQIAYIDGNKRYLAALRDAYRGHVEALEKAGKQAEARKYRSFLEILEPRGMASAPASPPSASVAAATSPPGAIVPRGKAEDEDPFAEGNSATRRARSVLVRAERAYEERSYETAARLYHQADRTEPGCVNPCQERWAYCRLVVVAQQLNRGIDEGRSRELEGEVKQAMRMSPRVEKFAQTLLARLREPGGVAEVPVKVKHTAEGTNGWAMAETSSFRIFHVGSQENAEKIARIAEGTRLAMTKKWFGEDARDWSPRCDLFIHPTAQAYSKATGAPAASPGHSSISLEAGRVVARRVDLRADNANMLGAVLPHETTHVVLAGRFGTHHVPRWADEGMAVLSEPRDRVELHLNNLPKHRREGMLFALSELTKMAEYPEPSRVGPFYAQGVSLVDFLCKKKDAQTFSRFLREGLDGRYETALERHYGYRSFAELEQDWRQHVFGEESVASVTEKRAGPAVPRR